MLVAVAFAVLLLFVVPPDFGFRLLARHPEARATVMLEHFAPRGVVHAGDIVLAVIMGFFLLTNAVRMAFRVWRGTGLPWSRLPAALVPLVVHGVTQKRWRDCEGGERKQWWRHLLLVTGYATLFALVVVFLPVFQVERGGLAGWHWTALFGYYGTAVLLATTLWIARDRWRKHDVIHRFSHQTDWLFLFLLMATVLSGILMHAFRMLDWPTATYLTYAAHLVIAVPMLAVEVPFGKWAHLLYRPLAVGLAAAAARSPALAEFPAGLTPAPSRAPARRGWPSIPSRKE
jgi:vacuolar-type H+-ATPase subunit I/STV1